MDSEPKDSSSGDESTGSDQSSNGPQSAMPGAFTGSSSKGLFNEDPVERKQGATEDGDTATGAL